MANFLLEIYSEEIPAAMQLGAAEQLEILFKKEATLGRVNFVSVNSFVTPRRLVLYVEGLPHIIKGELQEIKGPGINAPIQAVEGFCKSQNITKDELVVKDINGKEYYFAHKNISDQPAETVLSQVVYNILTKFQWPKSMRWNQKKERWIRPIRNILCLLDDVIVNTEFAGVKSSNFTYGHSFIKPGKLQIDSAEHYFQVIQNSFVILDQNKRKAEIVKQTKMLAESHNIYLAASDQLINEVTGLVEYPRVIIAQIDQKFLKLPPEILTTSMAIHQKYFSFVDSNDKFTPFFAIVANKDSSNEIIAAGNRKVLEARLYDAEFFYARDRHRTLSSRTAALEKVTFHSKLGSMLDKVKRISAIAEFIALKLKINNVHIIRAAHLCKTDLATEVVFEFPELQGIMGKYYALHDGENDIVAEAIEQHHWPLGKDGKCPESIEASIVSIADKIDTITGLFSVHEEPTSSKDPFALRRAAIGIIRIIIEHKLSLDLAELVEIAVEQFSVRGDISDKVKKFIEDRLVQYLKELNYPVEIIKVALEDNQNVYDIFCKVDSITKFLSSPTGEKIYHSIKRINNILIENKMASYHVDPRGFKTQYEQSLYQGLNKIKADIEYLVSNKQYFDAIKKFGEISDDITHFFDNVLVLDEDEKIRKNRLSLLWTVSQVVRKIADFSKIN